MPLTAARCTQCNGDVKVDPAQEAAVCTHCGTPFIIEKAINNYNTTLNINDSGVTADTLIARADLFLQNGDFAKADETYEKALERAPHDHSAHWGKFLCKLNVSNTSDKAAEAVVERYFNPSPSIQTEEAVGNLCRPHYDNAVRFAPADFKAKYVAFRDKLISFAQTVKEYDIKCKEAISNKIKSLQNRISSMNLEIENNDKEIKNLQHNRTRENKKEKIIFFVVFSVLSVIGIFFFYSLINNFGNFVITCLSMTPFGILSFFIVGGLVILLVGIKQKRNLLYGRIEFLRAESQKLKAKIQKLELKIN